MKTGGREMKRYFWSFLVIVVLIILAGAAVIWFGLYNVAADSPHWKLTFLILDAAKDRSIEVHSRGIVPPSLQGNELIDRGFRHFNETCRLCHGGPGIKPLEFTKGLYPRPPRFPSKDVQQDMSDAQLYWIVKHGLKMTGMPSFGVTYSDEDIWAIVAFVRRLPTLSPQEYEAMVQKAGLGSGVGEKKQP
jgi:mono/diheme cytochrome c family protein